MVCSNFFTGEEAVCGAIVILAPSCSAIMLSPSKNTAREFVLKIKTKKAVVRQIDILLFVSTPYYLLSK